MHSPCTRSSQLPLGRQHAPGVPTGSHCNSGSSQLVPPPWWTPPTPAAVHASAVVSAQVPSGLQHAPSASEHAESPQVESARRLPFAPAHASVETSKHVVPPGIQHAQVHRTALGRMWSHHGVRPSGTIRAAQCRTEPIGQTAWSEAAAALPWDT